jgi:hypothetical protein
MVAQQSQRDPVSAQAMPIDKLGVGIKIAFLRPAGRRPGSPLPCTPDNIPNRSPPLRDDAGNGPPIS